LKLAKSSKEQQRAAKSSNEPEYIIKHCLSQQRQVRPVAGRRSVPGQDPVVQHVRERAPRAPRGLRGEDPGVLGVHIGHGWVRAGAARDVAPAQPDLKEPQRQSQSGAHERCDRAAAARQRSLPGEKMEED
jgi:hypothetical protein